MLPVWIFNTIVIIVIISLKTKDYIVQKYQIIPQVNMKTYNKQTTFIYFAKQIDLTIYILICSYTVFTCRYPYEVSNITNNNEHNCVLSQTNLDGRL